MLHNGFLLLIAAVHLILAGSLLPAGLRHGRRLSPGELLFCFLLPVSGPLCGHLFLRAEDPDPLLLAEMMTRSEAVHRSYVAPVQEAKETAPMEETFLISTPRVRREMMMKLLNDDPGNNLELLMMARFNDDPETAHYATAALTEYQRRTELSLQQSQMLLSRQPDDFEERLRYIRRLESYIGSGLLEGHLLDRQRRLLEKELSSLPKDDADLELGCLRAANLLELRRTHDARQCAEDLALRFPGREEPWLMLLRVAVDSRDTAGLKALKERLAGASIQWSYAGREKIKYILES